MDKGQPGPVSSPPKVSSKRKADEYLRPSQGTKNIVNFLVGRQLGRQTRDIDMSKWVWMVTRANPELRWPLKTRDITYTLKPIPNHGKHSKKSEK